MVTALVLSQPAFEGPLKVLSFAQTMTESRCQTCAEPCLQTNLQWLLLGPVSDSLPDRSGVTLLIPVSLRASAQGEKLVSVLLTATVLWALCGVTGAPLAAKREI